MEPSNLESVCRSRRNVFHASSVPTITAFSVYLLEHKEDLSETRSENNPEFRISKNVKLKHLLADELHRDQWACYLAGGGWRHITTALSKVTAYKMNFERKRLHYSNSVYASGGIRKTVSANICGIYQENIFELRKNDTCFIRFQQDYKNLAYSYERKRTIKRKIDLFRMRRAIFWRPRH